MEECYFFPSRCPKIQSFKATVLFVHTVHLPTRIIDLIDDETWYSMLHSEAAVDHAVEINDQKKTTLTSKIYVPSTLIRIYLRTCYN